MAEPVLIGPFPCPWPNRGQGRVGPDKSGKGHWSGPAKVTKEQRRIVAAVMAGSCSVCGARLKPAHLGKGRWINALHCGHTWARVQPIQLPLHGPEHPVDVLLVRVPRAGAPHKGLDDDGAVAGAKAIRDQVTEELWPRDVRRRLIGTPDDSVDWLRFEVRQRPHRKARAPRRLPPGYVPGPPDPPNKGTELVEIWIATREDCGCRCRELLATAIEREAARSDLGLARALRRAHQRLPDDGPCGCGRSMLPVRWRRGEL